MSSADMTPHSLNRVFDAVGISWSYMMAFVVIASMAVILMFGLVQKWFISGLGRRS